MSMRRKVALKSGLLLAAILANAAPRNDVMRIKVLDSETRSVSLGGNDVPKNCDGVNFDAYCNNGKSVLLTNTLLVQEGDGPPFRIACSIDSRFSKCTPLSKGESFDARRVKRGITVYYVDDKGKARSQLYTLVDTDGKAGPPACGCGYDSGSPGRSCPTAEFSGACGSPACCRSAASFSGEGFRKSKG